MSCERRSRSWSRNPWRGARAFGTPGLPRELSNESDWNAPETVNLENSTNFYPSNKAIGRLFRDINLPAVQPRNTAARRRRRHLRDDSPEADLDEVFAVFCIEDRQEDLLESAVERRVAEFVEPNS